MALDEIVAALAESEGRSDTPFGLYVFRSGDAASDLARSVEREVFLEFFGNTAEMLAEEYDAYESASLFLCVVDHVRRRPAGVIRVLLPSPAGFKSLADLERVWGEPADEVLSRSGVRLDDGTVWDVATLAVSGEYRGDATAGLVSLGLYQGLSMLANAVEISYGIAIFDLIALDLIQTNFHRPFTPFTGIEPRRYLDSPSSLPVFGDMREYRARLAMIDPDLYELLFMGSGLESVLSSPLGGPEAVIDERWFKTA
jgi:hypothetical protein